MLALSLTQPLTACWIQCFPPEGTVPTGLFGGDSAVFIHCIRMFETGFFSPYANCHSALGAQAAANFPAPFFWLYGVAGIVGRAIGLDAFQTLAWVNAVCGFLYLFAVYRFLRAAFPAIANLAFALFALGGGPAGVLYILTGIAGLHSHAMFEPYFQRFVEYQLAEGVGLSPILMIPRVYYTLPLACCFGAITCCVAARGHDRWSGKSGQASGLSYGAACVLLFLGTLINQRFGPMAWAIILLSVMLDKDAAIAKRVRVSSATFLSVAAAIALGWGLTRNNLAYVQGTLLIGRNQIWLSPFIVAGLFYWLVVPREIAVQIRRLPPFLRLAAFGTIGYLAAFSLLYAGYVVYFGEYWRCLDFTSAVRISDWALIGVLPGVAWSLLRRTGPEDAVDLRAQWAALWFLAFVAVGISAFGQGWLLRLGPQRALAFLGVPLSVLAALGICRLRESRPRIATALTAAILSCGIVSILVASACFQGPLGHRPSRGAFAYTHCELMSKADAEALCHIGGGVVLAPVSYGPSFGDVIAQRRGLSTVYGYGTLCLSDRNSSETMSQVWRFFSRAASEQERRALVRDWCVDYVYCPDSSPVADDVLADLRNTPWLKETARCGRAVVFAADVGAAP